MALWSGAMGARLPTTLHRSGIKRDRTWLARHKLDCRVEAIRIRQGAGPRGRLGLRAGETNRQAERTRLILTGCNKCYDHAIGVAPNQHVECACASINCNHGLTSASAACAELDIALIAMSIIDYAWLHGCSKPSVALLESQIPMGRFGLDLLATPSQRQCRVCTTCSWFG